MQSLLLIPVLALASAFAAEPAIHTFTLSDNGTAASYDEALAVTSIQGIVNRDKSELYVLSEVPFGTDTLLDF
jgi:hypothetical protein